MLVPFGVKQHPAFSQKLNDLWICIKDVLAAKVLDIEKEISSVIDGTIDLEPVLSAYMKVVGAVTGRCVNTARAGFCGRFILEPYVELDLGLGKRSLVVDALIYRPQSDGKSVA